MSAYLSLDCLELVCPFYHFFPFFLSFSCLFPCFIGRLFIPFYLRCSHHRFLSFFFCLSISCPSLYVCLSLSLYSLSLLLVACLHLLSPPLPPSIYPWLVYLSIRLTSPFILLHLPHFLIKSYYFFFFLSSSW